MRSIHIIESIKQAMGEILVGPPRTILTQHRSQSTDDVDAINQELEYSTDVLDTQSSKLRSVADRLDKISRVPPQMLQVPRARDQVGSQLNKVLGVLHQTSNDIASVQYDVGDALDKLDDLDVNH